jgi:hypothetical protein
MSYLPPVKTIYIEQAFLFAEIKEEYFSLSLCHVFDVYNLSHPMADLQVLYKHRDIFYLHFFLAHCAGNTPATTLA